MREMPLTAHMRESPLRAHMRELPLTAHMQELPLRARMRPLPVRAHTRALLEFWGQGSGSRGWSAYHSGTERMGDMSVSAAVVHRLPLARSARLFPFDVGDGGSPPARSSRGSSSRRLSRPELTGTARNRSAAPSSAGGLARLVSRAPGQAHAGPRDDPRRQSRQIHWAQLWKAYSSTASEGINCGSLSSGTVVYQCH